ncbi:MAG: hypothetical protein IPO27_01745 [Bacteroidetes bacterium]|nr:hypothetical protein [Bacteroidota bacterium]
MINKHILSMMLLLCSSCTFAQKKYEVGLIGFYNLENLFDTIDGPNNDADFLPNGSYHYTGEVYLDKLNKLSDVISQIGIEESPEGLSMIGVAEIENRSVLEDLVKNPKLKDRHYKIIHYDSPDERGIDVGLLYNPRYFSSKGSEKLFVNLSQEGDTASRKTRDVLYVWGDYKGEAIHVFVNHWPSRRGGEEASAPGRAKAALVCKLKIDSILQASPKAKIFLMGDLNDDPTSPSVAKVLGAKGDLKKVNDSDLYNPWMDFYLNGIGTLAYNDAWNLFDQIIISEELTDSKQKGVFFKRAVIFNKPFMSQQTGRYKGYPKRTFDFNNYIGGYSDHFPTYLVLYKAISN